MVFLGFWGSFPDSLPKKHQQEELDQAPAVSFSRSRSDRSDRFIRLPRALDDGLRVAVEEELAVLGGLVAWSLGGSVAWWVSIQGCKAAEI